MYTDGTFAPMLEMVQNFLNLCLSPILGYEPSTELPSKMLELNDKTLPETLKGDKPVFVDFYAQWCPPCKRLAPTISTLAENLKDSVVVAKVDVEEAPDSTVNHNIEVLPTLVVFKGGKEVDRRTGGASLEVLTAWINKAIV